MPIRSFRPADAPALVRLSARCARTENDFVLNPLWESEAELAADFARHGADPESDCLVADAGEGEATGLSGLLRFHEAGEAGLLCPIVAPRERGRGLGGELLRAALARASDLGIKLVTAGIGTRNRAGYALLAACGFRPVRQHFLMRCDERPAPTKPAVPGLELEEATAGDAGAILELYSACGFGARSLAGMQAALGDGLHRHAVARLAGRVVAFAELDTHWPERPWVSFVGVREDLRAKGVGSALVAWSLARCFEAGVRSALLLLSPSNREALRAYEKAGIRRHRVIDVLERRL
jgi:ribosomal protein S18 acetylase RimI-like enzyme